MHQNGKIKTVGGNKNVSKYNKNKSKNNLLNSTVTPFLENYERAGIKHPSNKMAISMPHSPTDFRVAISNYTS
tara:strand:- start:301 stop:519 length:219 start_codon:yes stop_codon:yes gene_type:complete